MAKEIIMPKFGFTQESAEIVLWLKHEGDLVEQGDLIAEVTTDKVNMEVEAPATGILAGFRYQEGDVVPVTEVIAYVLEPGEQLPEALPVPSRIETVRVAELKHERSRIQATPVAEQIANEKGLDLSKVSGSGPGGRVTRTDIDNYLQAGERVEGKVRASPAARRIAHELGVNLHEVSGSGPHGRVQGEDVRQSATSKLVSTSVQIPESASSPYSSGVPEVVPFTNVRRIIAQRLQRSAQDAPHVYFEADINIGPLEELRSRANSHQSKDQPHISLTALLVRVVGWTLERHPFVNSRLEDENILLIPDIHVGVAVAADTGLVVPVVHYANQKSVTRIATELDDLTSRARQNRLLLDDVTGGTFTISNLGMFGVDRFTAIINPPQSAILSVGRARKVMVPDDNDRPVVRSLMSITLGADHRVVDGAIAARFLADLRECLEHPGMMAL